MQPEVDGKLLCRYCGRWFRSLGHHLVGRGRGVEPEAYRQEFELPATYLLMAADLREASAQRQQARFQDPAVRQAFAVDEPHHPERDRRRIRGLHRKAETESRAGVQRSKQAVGAVLGQVSRRRAARRREELDDRARALGYADLTQMLRSTEELTHAQLGQRLGMAPDAARPWREKEGVRSLAVQAAVRERAAGPVAGWPGPGRRVPNRARARQASSTWKLLWTAQEAARAEDGLLRCLECGTAWADLGEHVEGAHRLSQQSYRRRHALGADVSLRGAELDRSGREKMAEVGRASGRQRRGRVRGARAAEYDGVAALLAARTNPQAAQLLSVSNGHVTRIRRRCLAGADGGPSQVDRARHRQDNKARTAGYDNLVALLRDCTNVQVMEKLGVSRSQACRLRRRYLPEAAGQSPTR